MLKRVGNGLLYDDFNDNLGMMIGGIIGERINDTEANRLAKEKQAGIDQAKADQWNTDNASAIAGSNLDNKMSLAGFGGYDVSAEDNGLNVQELPSNTPNYKTPFDTSAFTNKFTANLGADQGFDFGTKDVSKDMFINRNRNRLPNAFSRLS